jgi:Ca-activated chloride channel family protein
MRFADPWLLLLLSVPAALGVRRVLRRGRPPEQRIGFPVLGFLAGEPAGRWARWRLVPDVLHLTALGLLVLALARPQVPHEVREVRSKARNLMLALDISSSMTATDSRASQNAGNLGEPTEPVGAKAQAVPATALRSLALTSSFSAV